MEIYNKYKIEHTDGTPLKGKKYFVLRLDSDDPIESARVARAMRAYEGKLRNCDVGTADEQLPRFVTAWESAYKSIVDSRLMMMLSIFSRWVQMPYEQEGVAE